MYFSTGERHYEQFSQYSALKVTVVLYIITIGSAERGTNSWVCVFAH